MSDTIFDWRSPDNTGDIVFPTHQGIAVYLNPDGDIVIRQEGYRGEDDQFVVVPLNRAKSLLAAIRKEIAQAGK